MLALPDMIEQEFLRCRELAIPYTMTGPEKQYALHNAVRWVIETDRPGAFVECGVWKGGSIMMIAATLKMLGITDRDIYLYDTFEGMTPPTEADVDWKGNKVSDLLAESEKDAAIWACSALDEVRDNLSKTGYPMERFKFIKGDVLGTIPKFMPDEICLLRLDTDWYESVKHGLVHLFPRLLKGGVLILDDYGWYKGARKAVDEYFGDLPEQYLMHRIDHSGRLIIKTS